MADPRTNFAKATLTAGIDASATTFSVASGKGALFPNTTLGAFNVVIWNSTDYPDPSDDPNKEILRVTARSSDTFTVSRAQEGTTAMTHNTVGKEYRIILTITAKTIEDLLSDINTKVTKGGDGGSRLTIGTTSLDDVELIANSNVIVKLNATNQWTGFNTSPSCQVDILGTNVTFGGNVVRVMKEDFAGGGGGNVIYATSKDDDGTGSINTIIAESSPAGTLSAVGVLGYQTSSFSAGVYGAAKNQNRTSWGGYFEDTTGVSNKPLFATGLVVGQSFSGNDAPQSGAIFEGNVGFGLQVAPQAPIHIATTGVSAYFDRYVSSPYSSADVRYRTARGTYSSPQATQSGDYLGTVNFCGYSSSGTPGFTTSNAAIFAYAGENFTSTAQGAGLHFYTTPIGSIGGASASWVRMIIDPSGNVGVGTGTTPADSRMELLSTGTNIFSFGRSGYDKYGFYSSSGTGFSIRNFTDSRDELFFDGNGNIGVGGTVTPQKRFHAAGTTAAHEMQTDMGLNLYYVPSPTSLSGVVSAGGSVDTGTHYYSVTFTTAIGESRPYFIASPITTTTGNNTVTLTIPTSTDYRVTGRKIYRCKAGMAAFNDYLLATINNNTATSYVDTAADSTLTGTQGASYFRTNTTNYGIRMNDITILVADSQYTKLGYNAAGNLTTGGRGVAIGSGAQQNLNTGSDNHTVGHSGMTGLTTGAGNCGFGYGVMAGITTGSYNTATGHDAMIFCGGSGVYNTTNGAYAGFGVSGTSLYSYVTINGAYAGYSLTTGNYNTFNGYQAGYGTTTGERGIHIGSFAGKYETAGYKLIVDTFDRVTETTQRTSALLYGIFSATNTSQVLSLGGGGRVGINNINPTAYFHLPAGTATANTAPLKFTSGTLNTTPEEGAVEFDGSDFYITNSSRAKIISSENIGTNNVMPNTLTTDLTYSGQTMTATAGESLVFGDVCYAKSDGKMWKADANGTNTYPVRVMALGTINADASGTFLIQGKVRNDAWSWTIGGTLYLSTTAGSMTQTQPAATDDVIQVLGYAFPNADTIIFNPEGDIITRT